MHEKNFVKKNMLIYYYQKGKEIETTFLSKISILSLYSTPQKKTFLALFLQAFGTEEILKFHITDCFEINGKQQTIMPKKSEYVKLKNYEKKKIYIQSPLIICADFESILVSKNNGKQNLEESYTNKYQKHIACSYDHKLVCVDDKFSKYFKTYLEEDAVYKLVNSMIEESKDFTVN